MIKRILVSVAVFLSGLTSAAPAYANHTVSHTREMLNLTTVELATGAMIIISVSLSLAYQFLPNYNHK